MKLEYALTLKDYKTFKSISKRNQQMSKLRFLIIPPVFLLVMLIFWLASGRSAMAGTQLNLVIAAAFIGLFANLAFILFVNQRRQNREFSKSHFCEPRSLVLEDTAIIDNGLHQTTSWKWSAFKHVTSANGCIYIWIEKFQAVIIPATAFATQEERQHAFEFIKERIQQRP